MALLRQLLHGLALALPRKDNEEVPKGRGTGYCAVLYAPTQAPGTGAAKVSGSGNLAGVQRMRGHCTPHHLPCNACVATVHRNAVTPPGSHTAMRQTDASARGWSCYTE